MSDSNPTPSLPSPPSSSFVGKLLVASSITEDPVLSRSVSLVVHQDAEHVIAVMLNRPMNPNPAALMQMLKNSSDLDSAEADSGDATLGEEVLDEDDLPSFEDVEEWMEHEMSFEEADFPSDELDEDLEVPFGDEYPSMDEDAGIEKSESEKVGDSDSRIGHLAAHAHQTASDVAPAVGQVHFGGPLSGPVVAVHGLSEFAEAQTGEGVYVAAQRQLLESLVRQKPGPFRLIVGHLGWSVAQFAAEMEAGHWHVIDATSQAVLEEDSQMWPRLIRRATSSSVARWVGVSDNPEAAMLN